ncbi:hypothetical protein FRB90_005775 [Tulasnella sp. 427]|nr:hypothetical protein FRB90_005775 [Tulasnella sp. 427]
MVFKHHSREIKERAMILYRSGWPASEVAYLLDVSEKSMDRWDELLQTEGDVVRPPSYQQGRPSILNDELRYELLEILAEDSTVYIDQLRDFFAVERDVGIGRSTLQKILQDIGVTRKKLKKEAAEADAEEQVQYLNRMRGEYQVHQLVAVDESAKDDRTIYRQYGRSLRGQRAFACQPFQRDEKWSILPAMSADSGYLALRVIEGAVDGHQFFDFIVEDVLPLMTPFPGPRSVLLMDNCAIHTSELLCEMVEQHGCRVEFTPPYSPELNPIEMSFSFVKGWLKKHWERVEHEDSEHAIREACQQVTPEKATAWFYHSGYE